MARYIKNINMCSKEISDDYYDYMETFKDPISLLYQSVTNNSLVDVKKIITRMHTINLYYYDSKDLKSVVEWQNNTNIMQPHIVSIKIPPITQDKKYSDLSLVEDKYLDSIRYPLINSYSSVSKTFKTSTYPKFLDFKRIIANTGAVICSANDSSDTFVKSTQYLNFNPKKINLKIFVKNYLKGYAITDQEKTIGILDQLIDYIVAKIVKEIENKSNNFTFTSQEKCISKLFALILTNRALDYGNVKDNLAVERCLNLQLCNKLNAMNIDSKRLKSLFKISITATEELLNRMNFTTKEIYDLMISKGYTYKKRPTSIIEVLTDYYSESENVKLKELQNYTSYDQPKSEDQVLSLPKGTLNLNKNTITRKSANKHIDSIVIKNIYKKIQSLSGKVKQAKSDKKINSLKSQIKLLEDFIGKYVLQSYSSNAKYDYKITIQDENSTKLKRLIAITLQIKKEILEKLFANEDRVNNDKKIDINTFINSATLELFNQKSFTVAFTTLISQALAESSQSVLTTGK